MGKNAIKIETLLSVWRAQIAELAIEAENASPRKRFGFYQRIDELKAKSAVAQAKLDRVRPADP